MNEEKQRAEAEAVGAEVHVVDVAAQQVAEPAASGLHVSSMDIIKTLLAADVDPNPEPNMHRPGRGGNSGRFVENQLSTGCTPLFRAAQSGDMEVIQALL